MNKNQQYLKSILKDSKYKLFLDCVPSGFQLPSAIATINELKPSMDLWIKKSNWNSFVKFVKYFGLKYLVKDYFDLNVSKKYLNFNFNTTTASLDFEFSYKSEAHVFISKSIDNLIASFNSGWYPLIYKNTPIEKHPIDHYKFGEALGYPHCCREFFFYKNDWNNGNHLYSAYLNSSGNHNILCNCFHRSTEFSLIPHLTCSFNCYASTNYAENLLDLINKESSRYGVILKRQLSYPVLYLSEQRMFLFKTLKSSKNYLEYEKVSAINPTSRDDYLFNHILIGNRVIIENNIVRIYKDKQQIYAYKTRSDKYGPEAPFIFLPV